MKQTEIIKEFLTKLTHADLAELYSYDMEVQVNVAQDNGERVEGEFHGKRWTHYTDGMNTWKPFRIPYNANSKPNYVDKEITYDLYKHAEGIGMTGWDWVNLVSRWVAFDFDAIVGHSASHTRKLSEHELREVRDAINEIPWTTTRLSTSGSGLHIYVFFKEPVPTSTHTEHAALGRAILGMMCSITGKDLFSKVDACGQNMWIWHRKMKDTKGLTLVKAGVPLDNIPLNWKDHINVVSGKRTRTLPKFIEDENKTEEEMLFEELSGQRVNTSLDEQHRKLIEYLYNEKQYSFSYDSDHNMIITHTIALKLAHEALGLKGIFETSTSASSMQNCFAFPMRNGAWVVRRFTRGVQEHPTWDQDRKGWTRCYYNREPDLKTVAAKYEAIEHHTGGYVFNDGNKALAAANDLGAKLNIPEGMRSRPVKLKLNKDDRLLIEMEQLESDLSQNMQGWLKERKKWKQVTTANTPPKYETEVGNYDDVIRHITDIEGNDCGWALSTDGKTWRNEPLTHVKLLLCSLGLDDDEIKKVQGLSVSKCWRLVNMPFKQEYPGDRLWNRNAPQLAIPPSTDIDNLSYPTWTKILNHCGEGLNDAVKSDQWCRENHILTGADYLKCWIASVIKNPTEPLPYLFFYSKEQNTGKSSFHDALNFLFRNGVVRADHALSDQQFNGELENAVICVIEEKNLNDAKGKIVNNKIKDWVTSKYIAIRHMYKTPYTVLNTTHWIHCSNDQSALPILPGDTRIVMLHVSPLSKEDLIPRRELEKRLQKEAPDFLCELLNLEIPDSKDRLALPVISTYDKDDAMSSNLDELELFVKENCYYCPGNLVTFTDFYERFTLTLSETRLQAWSKQRVSRELDRHKYPRGQTNVPGVMVGNIAFDANVPSQEFKYVGRDKKLEKRELSETP